MQNEAELTDLINRASGGEKEVMERLAELAEVRVRAFLHRSTLDTEVSEEVTQETLLQMVNSLGDLRTAESFWPWLLRIASNKMNDYYRRAQQRGRIRVSRLDDSLLERVVEEESEEASSAAVRRELVERIMEAMGKLGVRQRAVVSLRCFEGMSYAEISEAVGCKKSDARVTFFRARRSLYKYLRGRGFSKNSLPAALLLFGKLTAPSKGAISVAVSEEALMGAGVGALPEMIWRSRAVKVAMIAVVGALIAGWLFWGGGEEVLLRKDVRSVHYVVQGVLAGSGSSSSSSSSSGEGGVGVRSKGFYERWLYFPEGPDGPVLRREQRWNVEQTGKLCSWLQDGNANYYYHSWEKRLYITNDPLGALVLPTDGAAFTGFIRELCGGSPKICYSFNPANGLALRKIDNRSVDVANFTTEYEYNIFDESVMDYGWGASVGIVDKRDAMHKRGWTYFRVDGLVGKRSIEGSGRIPFIYSAYQKNPPWMRLSVGRQFMIVDTPAGAFLCDATCQPIFRFSSGAFFCGLGRPWIGIRAYDSVRRDAARARLPFEYSRKGEEAEVKIIAERDYTRTKLCYFIDMEKDIIEEISFSVSGGPTVLEGRLEFSYLSDVEGCGEEFSEPELQVGGHEVSEERGIMWLAFLAEGRLEELAN